ncbi:DUF4339 domain-containing protein [Frigoriglobus tundricola]|uniref:GYF domain-containing protein n=1 Tax=Frigoriglobus tundricola TaxID=2774151 RepID=A0A6M5YUC1_9BACT|nr:DUF4339 domain-containing protein [Frigoriglobus tundricola]QJW96841.1 hypothetical protein FTUN_4401 [Frigoriglobus tundricola]
MDPVWYFVVNGAQTGPVSFAELKAAAAAGKLSPGDLAWQEGTADWVPAGTVVGVFSPARPQPGAVPLPAAGPEPLSLDDEPPRRNRSRRPRRARDDAEPSGMPDWLQLIPVLIRRATNPDRSRIAPVPDEESALGRAGVMDPTARKFAVWRRSVLFVAAVPCAFAALFGLVDMIGMNKEEREPFSTFGLLLLYLQAFALFSLPAAAVLGALSYDRLAASARWVLVGGLVSFGVPLAVAFVPGDWLIDLKMTSSTTVQEAEAARGAVGAVLGVQFYLLLMPAVLSLLPAVSRACVLMKLLLPESLVPGWGLVTSIPLCALLTLSTFVMLYHLAGNALLITGLLLWVGAPLLYLTRFDLLTRPITAPADREALVRTAFGVFGLIALGMALLIVYLFTAKFLGKTLVGFDSATSIIRPWKLELHRKWIEYVGRSLFLSVFFADLLLRIALSVWREERAFSGTAPAAAFDHTMSGLGSAVLPRGSAPPVA